MINIELLKQLIEKKYEEVEGMTNKIINLSAETGIAYSSIYKIISSKTCNLKNLIILKQTLGFEYSEMIVE